ncbi:MAG: MBL fold metallo-hydrolase [Opitutales bacterium]
MIRPLQQDEAFLEDVRKARAVPEAFHVWWLGQSGFLLQWKQRSVLFDPYLSDSLTKKYAATDKPHERMTERVVAPEKLDFIDFVTSSHNHTDHLDPETLQPLAAANPGMKFVFPAANKTVVTERLGRPWENSIELDAGVRADANGFSFTGIPAAHNEIERDESGRCRFLGFVVEFGPWQVYFSGDTLWHPELVSALSSFKPDLALLPINGNRPERRVAGNLDGEEAARLAKEIGAAMVIPCHYEMFAFNTVSPEPFVRACQKLGQPHTVLRAGERWSSPGVGSRKSEI